MSSPSPRKRLRPLTAGNRGFPADVEIFDRLAAREQLLALCDTDGFLGPEEEWDLSQPDEALSSEERGRFKALRCLLSDARGSRRPFIFGNEAMIDAISAIKLEAPNFGPLLEVCNRAVMLSKSARSALRLPPILAVGGSGYGKTRVLKRLSKVLGTSCITHDMPSTAAFRWRGQSVAWKGAKPGLIARGLIGCPTAQPTILLDEFDKASVLDRASGGPFDIFHGLMEEENAAVFVDDFFEVSFDCRFVLWFASANDVRGIPESILSRMLVIDIPPPTDDQLLTIFETIYREANERHRSYFEGDLDDLVRHSLLPVSPRQAKRVIDVAMGHAAESGRRALQINDVQRAKELICSMSEGTFRHPVGFCR